MKKRKSLKTENLQAESRQSDRESSSSHTETTTQTTGLSIRIRHQKCISYTEKKERRKFYINKNRGFIPRP